MFIDNFSANRVATDTTSLSELMSAFSYALDITEGQPEGHSIRSCYIAIRIADMLGLDDEARRAVFYTALLKDLGCSSNAARIAEIYLTDDRTFKHDFKLIAPGLGPTLKFVFSQTGQGHRLGERARAIGNILKNGPEIARSLIETRCTRGADIARRLRFPEAVAGGIAALDEHWDGTGKPLGLTGEEIVLPARLALLAQIADVFFTAAGPDAARQEIARHRGGWLDPDLCDAFATLCADNAFWATLAGRDVEKCVQDLEPETGRIAVDEDYLDDIALAFGQVIDAKSPYTSGHSERVGGYFDAVARQVGLDETDRRGLRRAAILHDVGKLGVSSSILEKPGKLDADEWEVMRSHARHTTTILARIAPFRELALIAGSHHERLDGKGYPRGLDQRLIHPAARMITVCDFYDALTADRPYRGAMPPEQALAIMERETGQAIDPECFTALQNALQSAPTLAV